MEFTCRQQPVQVLVPQIISNGSPRRFETPSFYLFLILCSSSCVDIRCRWSNSGLAPASSFTLFPWWCSCIQPLSPRSSLGVRLLAGWEYTQATAYLQADARITETVKTSFLPYATHDGTPCSPLFPLKPVTQLGTCLLQFWNNFSDVSFHPCAGTSVLGGRRGGSQDDVFGRQCENWSKLALGSSNRWSTQETGAEVHSALTHQRSG